MDPQRKRMPNENVMTVGPERAARELRERLGPLVEAEYVPGKTLMRDMLCEAFGLSQLESEQMCDSLEAAEVLRFVDLPEGRGWHIHYDS